MLSPALSGKRSLKRTKQWMCAASAMVRILSRFVTAALGGSMLTFGQQLHQQHQGEVEQFGLQIDFLSKSNEADMTAIKEASLSTAQDILYRIS